MSAIHDHSLPCTGTDTSIKSGGVLIEMMRSSKCFPHMGEIPIDYYYLDV
jgi:hypothetical protein